jgi:hypothetical protein
VGAVSESEHFALRGIDKRWIERQNKRLIIVWRGVPLKAQFLSTAPKQGIYAKQTHKCPFSLHF